jgi:hypothetical protein
MMCSRSAAVSTLTIVLVLGALFEASTGAAKARTPKIVAKPTSVMVNRPVKLRGSGFKPNATFTVEECGQTNWIAPQSPCASGNSVMVTTNAKGKFKATMTAMLCPQASPPTLTEETCYIGEVSVTGIDTLELVGAAPITVSWP